MNNSFCGRKRFTSFLRGTLSALTILTLAGLAACAASGIEKSRTEALKQYETMVRWSQWDAAAEFIAPEYLEEHPITRLDMERLRLFRVTQYTVRSAALFDEGMTARQTVEIHLFNTNQAVERSIIDEQEWRYDPTLQVWRLYSGLPDPTKRL